MDPRHFFPPPSLHLKSSISTYYFLLLLLAMPNSHGQEIDYRKCQYPFKCGLLNDLLSPFWGGKQSVACGRVGYKLDCREGEFPFLVTQPFRVINVNSSSKMMTIARDDYFSNGICQENPSNTTLDTTFLVYDPGAFRNVSIFYNCSQYIIGLVPVSYRFTCSIHGGDGFYANEGYLRSNPSLESEVMRNCKVRVEVPAQREVVQRLESSKNVSVEAMLGVLKQGFIVSYGDDCLVCVSSGGNCTYDGRNYLQTCTKIESSNTQVDNSTSGEGRPGGVTALVIGAILGAPTTLLILYSLTFSLYKGMHNKENGEDIRTIIRNFGALAMKKYYFEEIKKITNSFKDKLGEGGFANVYKGKLFNGQLVAVKVLKASKENRAEFLNEVASISRTSHVNVVSLLGYCFEQDKRVLVYEFMPNGSLDKFIHNRISCSNPRLHLDWKKLLVIAIGVARGLEYLHCGCKTRIIHFDIKPHNILLDDNFDPKISDFGLAKLFSTKESIISMHETRGTIGYIAPELFDRNYGGVSSKSDVYSFGMLLLDVVGARQQYHIQVDNASGNSNCYFPHWIYKQIELEKYDFFGPLTMGDVEVVKRMTLVGLWCIQTIPSNRPVMSQIIEMLEGSTKIVKTPPKTFLDCSLRLLLASSTSCTTEVQK